MWRFGGVGRDVLKSFVSMLILPTLDRVERNSGPQHCSLMDMDDLHRWNLAAGLEPTYWCLSKARSLLPGLDGTWDTISDQYGIQILLPPWPTQPSSLPSVTQNNEAPRTFSSSHSYRAVHLFFLSIEKFPCGSGNLWGVVKKFWKFSLEFPSLKSIYHDCKF